MLTGRRLSAALLGATLLLGALFAAALSSYAEPLTPKPPTPIQVTPGGGNSGTVIIEVTSPWGDRNGGDNANGSGGGSDGLTPAERQAAACATAPSSQACAAYFQSIRCSAIVGDFVGGVAGWTSVVQANLNQTLAASGCPPSGAAPPRPTAAQLAAIAYGLLRLPAPLPARYPSGTLRDGRAYTIVKTHMWFSTSAASWQPQSRTVCVGALCATATAKPTSLSLDPGNGDQAVSCPGPGTAFVRPSGGSWVPGLQPQGCDYLYVNSTYGSPDGELTATYTITWTVTWTGTNGTAGTLNPLTTATGSTFAVAELQSVVTR